MVLPCCNDVFIFLSVGVRSWRTGRDQEFSSIHFNQGEKNHHSEPATAKHAGGASAKIRLLPGIDTKSTQPVNR